MDVKVCDAICGAGKTLSCINMINSDTEHRYLFITPYLDEVDRIKSSCSSREFVAPERLTPSGRGTSKLKNLTYLLRAGRNIVSTHALFSNFTEETKQLVRDKHYVLVLDEVINLFTAVDMDSGDVDFLKRSETVIEDEDKVIWKDDNYRGSLLKDIKRLSESRDMVDYDGSFYFWSLPIDIFQCFESVYVLTYMFDYQLLKYCFDAYGIDYELIGTKKENGVYQFCPLDEMDRRRDLRNLVHICEDVKFNKIGGESFSLSSGWFGRAAEEEGQPKLLVLKNNLYNIFRHKGTNETNKMWTTLNKYRPYLKGKGYANSFIAFNCRASNNYTGKNHLAYCVNVYMMPWVRNYLCRIGAKHVSQDMYALSMLVQWLFRSAIRNGEEIWIYVPSRRMRWLLKRWLENLAKGEDLEELHYKQREARGEDAFKEVAYRLRENEKEEKKIQCKAVKDVIGTENV